MIAIIDYNAGNTLSVQHAIEGLGYKTLITSDNERITQADKVIFPGVGQAQSAMNSLKANGLDCLIPQLKQPVLGICLGMQLLCLSSEEGNTTGLGIFKTKVREFPAKDLVPHMGWNNHTALSGVLFEGITTQDDFYFVHRYFADCCAETIAQMDYINPFSSALNHKNFYGTQFHPEKSGKNGLRLLTNFLNL